MSHLSIDVIRQRARAATRPHPYVVQWKDLRRCFVHPTEKGRWEAMLDWCRYHQIGYGVEGLETSNTQPWRATLKLYT